jgi:hypothetical protein
LEEAAEREKGLRQRGKTPATTTTTKGMTGMGTDAGGYDAGTVSG